MRRIFVPATLLAVLLIVLFGSIVFSTKSLSQSHVKHELILMRCETIANEFRVTTYSGSQSAPSKTTENCPETLARLHRDGFEIEHIGYFYTGDGYIVYTLTRY